MNSSPKDWKIEPLEVVSKMRRAFPFSFENYLPISAQFNCYFRDELAFIPPGVSIMSFMGADVSALSSLLDQSRAADEDINVARQNQQPPMTLGSTKVVLGGGGGVAGNIGGGADTTNEKKQPSKDDIWQMDEIPTEDAILSTVDDRPAPRYEYSYKQEVGTQDSMFGMNGKTPGSMDCSHLVVKVHFPGCTMRDLDLDVTRDRIKAASPHLKLFTYLPHPVRHDEGKAAFDRKTEVLTVTLPIINELFE